jgi:PilZ domain-containing protein
MQERRRHPRRLVEDEVASLPAMINAQVLDITPGGALLRTTRPVDVGTRGVFRLNLGGETFTAQMQVRRVTPARGSLGFLLGTTFVNVSAADEQLLERFMTE